MKPIRLEVSDFPGLEGRRLDVFLSLAVPELSRSAAERLISGGDVAASSGILDKKRIVAQGDVFTLELPELKPVKAFPEDIPLDIFYEDSDMVIVNKPRGMVVHPAAGHYSGTLVNALLHHCAGSLSGIGGALRPGIVHRLDKDTSGLIVCAKNDFSHNFLASELKDRRMGRIYETVATGGFDSDSFSVDAPVGRHPSDRKKMAVKNPRYAASGIYRNALTHFEVIGRYRGYTHLRCKLDTGRTHQIRVHLSHLGHPVAGDPLYGSPKEALKLGGQILHARRLTLVHPRTRENMDFNTNLPEYFTSFLSSLDY